MKKSIFIIRGVSNSGKTHTVRHIAQDIILAYMDKKRNSKYIEKVKITIEILKGMPESKELLCLIKIELNKRQIVLGICTAGDTPELINKEFQKLISANCDIIVCGCKGVAGRNNTEYSTILNICKGFAVHTETTKRTKSVPEDPVDYDIANSVREKMANAIDKKLGIS